MVKRRPLSPLVLTFAAVTLVPAALFFVASLGLEFGWWPARVAYDLLFMQVAWLAGFVALAAAAMLTFLAFRKRASWWLALGAACVAILTVGAFASHRMAVGRNDIENVSTDRVEIPGFGRHENERGQGGPTELAAEGDCPGALSIPDQIAPGSAAWALEQAGFDDIKAGVGRATGVKRGFWFGFDMDAVIRIRPERTDIRVAARDGRPHGGQACRLATKISERLRAP